MIGRPAASVAELVLLSAWLGAAVLFSAAVAPAAFAVLPSRTLAGALVGRVLPVILLSGMVLGVAVVVLEVAAGTRWKSSPGPAALATLVSCAVAQFAVGARIDRVRAQIPGPVDSLPIGDPLRVAFGRLHAVSVGWLGLAMVAAVGALAIAARSLQSRS
jgi:hypothetical protein